MSTSKSFLHWASSRGALLAWLCCAAAIVPVLLQGLAGSGAWLPGLAIHWQWLYLLLGLPACLAALAGRRWHALAAAAAIVLAWSLASPAVQASDAKRGIGRDKDTLAVASANLNYETRDFAPLRHWLLSGNAPDLVALQEFTPAAREALLKDEAIRQAYPHQVLAPAHDQFGLAILSRFPIVHDEQLAPASGLDTLMLRAAIDWSGREIALTAVHPMPPVDAAYAAARDRSIREQAQQLSRSARPGLLVGDMNDTPWSSGLKGAFPMLARANDLTPTWPNAWGWLSLLPLDHVLATQQWRVLDSARGPDLGSDHRPLVVRLHLPR